MKRYSLLIFLAILIFVIPLLVHAASSDVIEQQTGINPQNIPQDAEQLKDQYLKQNWAGLVEKNVLLGPIHKFFVTISPVFLVILGENYSLSPTFLFVLLLWIYLAMEITKFMNSAMLLNKWANAGISIGACIVLAQLGLFRGIGRSLASIFYSQEAWWMRVIICLAIFVALFVLHYIIKISQKQMKFGKKAALQKALENKVSTQEEFIKGFKQGASLDK